MRIWGHNKRGVGLLVLLVPVLAVAGACIPVEQVELDFGPVDDVADGGDELSIDTADAGTVQVTPGEPAESVSETQLDGEAPVDARSGTVSVSADQIELEVAGPGKLAAAMQEAATEARIVVHIAPAGEDGPCADEFEVLDFTATLAGEGSISLTGQTSAPIAGATLERTLSDRFGICIRATANFTGTVTVRELDVTLSTDAPPAGDDTDNDNDSADDQGGPDDTKDDGTDAPADDGDAAPGDGDPESPDDDEDEPQNDNAADNDDTSDSDDADDDDSVKDNDNNEEAENTAPVADAGANQVVEAGDLVTLDGTASSDADGDALTFSWSQESGTPVALTSAETALATFTAPDVAETLTFRLEVSDGTATAATAVAITIAHREDTMLFVANAASPGSAIGFRNPAAANGDISPTTVLSGDSTRLDKPFDVVTDNGTELLVLSNAAGTVNVYTTEPTGDLAPLRSIAGGVATLDQPAAMAYYSADDLLFVSNGDDSILVFDEVSSPAFDGSPAPVLSIANDELDSLTGLTIDRAGRLYAASQGTPGGDGPVIVAFDRAGGLDGTSPPRLIRSAQAVRAFNDVFVDGADRLFAVGVGDRAQIHVFDGASTLDGTSTPNAVLIVPTPPAVEVIGIVVDAHDTAYILDRGANAIFVYDKAGTLDGETEPDRTIQGPATELDSPAGLHLWVPFGQ